ncbi:hypothetical protein, partial [Oceaniferula marina]|uniref:hypothetical protein n=1 Tax=Oceaniferula marina TaxID=2748318 RepID=UPI0015BA4384
QDEALKEIKTLFSDVDIRFEASPDGEAIFIHYSDEYFMNEAIKSLEVFDTTHSLPNSAYIDLESLSIENAMALTRGVADGSSVDTGVSADYKNGKWRLLVMGDRDYRRKIQSIIKKAEEDSSQQKQAQQVVAPDS